MGGIFVPFPSVGTSTLPFVHIFNSGSGTETVPNGASQVVVECWGGGGGGQTSISFEHAGGGGGYCKKTMAIIPANWGSSISYSVGASGAAGNPSGTGGGQTTVSTYGLTANGGSGGKNGVSPTPGGTASGGDVNTTGGSSTGSFSETGGNSPNGGSGGGPGVNGQTPGGGGGGALGGGVLSGSGANGRVTFTWS